MLPFLELARYSRQQREAAKQMWDVVRRGVAFEVPVSLSTDDNTMKAVELLLKQHPEVTLAHERVKKPEGGKVIDGSAMVTFQSRGLVLGLRRSFAVSDLGLEMLAKGGYHPEAASLMKLFAQHEAFMRSNANTDDVNAAVKRAQTESAERNRVEVSGHGKLEVLTPTKRTETADQRAAALALLVEVMGREKPEERFHPDIEKGTPLTWRSDYSVEFTDGWTYRIQWRELPEAVRALYAKVIGYRVRGGGAAVKDLHFEANELEAATQAATARANEAGGFVMLEERLQLLGLDTDDPTQFALFRVFKKE